MPQDNPNGKDPHFFATKQFFPLFITQFLGAFNDNLFRQAVIILITFRFASEVGMSPPILTNLAVGLFILPFFIFSALAGQLADKYEKANQIVWIKIWEIALMVVGAVGFYIQSLPLLIAVLAGLGLQSTFFGPIKYGILPDLMKRHELLGANALVEAGTFIAILGGTIIGGMLVLSENGLTIVSLFMIAIAVIGTFSGRAVPKTGQAAPELTVQYNIFASTKNLIKTSWSEATTKGAILGISWIWLLGTIFIAQIPDIVKNLLDGGPQIVTLFMACFSLGIGVGSLLCNKILKGALTARLAAPGLIALAIASGALYLALPDVVTGMAVQSLSEFMSHPLNWFITGLMTFIAIAAGIVIVPLYAVLQNHTARAQRSRVMAATNIVNSAFMALGSLLAAALIGFGLSSPDILLLVGMGNLVFVPIVLNLEKTLPD